MEALSEENNGLLFLSRNRCNYTPVDGLEYVENMICEYVCQSVAGRFQLTNTKSRLESAGRGSLVLRSRFQQP